MNARLLFPFLMLAGLTSGCIIEGHAGDDCVGDCGGGGGVVAPRPGDVSFGWSFDGLRCADVPEVKSVRIHIPGESLHNDGVFPCLVDGEAGVVLADFLPRDYSFTLEARGYGGEVFYAGEGYVTVDGDVHVDVDLAPVGTSHADLSWNLPPLDGYAYPTCAQAGIASVEVYLDGAYWKTVPCEWGQGAKSVTTPELKAGTHTLELYATDSHGYTYFSFHGSLRTYAARPVYAEYDLKWAVGGTALDWRLVSGDYTKTCAEAGIDTVTINFRDAAGDWLYDWADPAIRYGCTSAPLYFDYLPAGVHTVSLKATGPGGTYLPDAYDPPVVGVKAGEWPSAVVTVPLFRQP